MRSARLRTVFLAVFLVVLGLATASPSLASPAKRLPLTRTAPDSLTRALARGELTQAQYALERAASLFHPGRVAARYGPITRPNPRDATLILRDLVLRVGDLSGAGRQRAVAILARPTDSTPGDPDRYSTTEATPVCATHVCIHYVTTTADAVDSTDDNDANGAPGPNGVPDYVDDALRVFESEVWGEEVTNRGFRAPKSDFKSVNDGTSASDPTGGKFDVYLAEIGDENLYGYCTTDDPHWFPDWNHVYKHFDASAYCVVDNDFDPSEFPAHTALENLEVTAAHEFFHAVQFSYDWLEDQWMLEATATWMEDEIYDDVNDNRQYLSSGPLKKPRIPLDRSSISQTDLHVYGDWIFFRYLTEKYGPGLVKTIWKNADGAAGGRDDYSIQAIARALSKKGGFRARFAEFGWRNRIARVTYQEGQANSYPQSPLSSSANTLSHSNRSKSKSIVLKHQTNGYFEFKRGSGLSSSAKLTLVLNLPSKSTGAAASVLVFNKNGTVSPFTLGITSSGGGTFKVPFGSNVSRVDVVLSNGSTRYKRSTCFSDKTPYACGGAKSLDDGHAYKFTAKV
jgi:hypothetical protein